jgi:hypothetical protein
MGKFKKILRTTLLICFIVAFFVFVALKEGITSFNGILEVVVIMFLINLGVALVIFQIIERVSFKKASERELKAEDDILLQATAFSQAAVWIYLTLIPEDEKTFFFKLLVPSVAILFYCLRAIGKLKDNNKFRHYSMFVLSFVIGFSAYVLIDRMTPFWEGFLVIDGVEMTFKILAPIFLAAPVLLSVFFYDKLRTRYGLT